MEHLPKVVYGCPEKTIFPVPGEQKETISANCNICRNFKNVHDRKHRNSKVHQNKLTERFRIIKSKMKINLDSVTVHDAEWGEEEEYYCYFCDKPVKKHACDDGFTVEFMGLMKHLSELHHRASVKSYLKYHGREENIDVFCKSKGELEKFMAKVTQAKKKYLSKLDILNKRDVTQIREAEVERQKVVQDALQATGSAEFSKTNYDRNDHKMLQSSQMTPRFKMPSSSNVKIPPWLVEKAGNKSDLNESTPTPIIGPTMETLIKHVAAQEKKALPSKRIIGNMKHKSIISEKWLPSFSGVWNKKRRRPSELNSKKK